MSMCKLVTKVVTLVALLLVLSLPALAQNTKGDKPQSDRETRFRKTDKKTRVVKTKKKP